MTIEFDKTKEKNLIMMIETSGIDNDDLDFTFNIRVGGVRYGFPCDIKENKVVINIPPLDDVINDLEKGEYPATLDVTGDDKYFMRPFNEDIVVIQSPEVIIDKESLKEDKVEIGISEIIEGFNVDDKPKPKVVEKKKETKKDPVIPPTPIEKKKKEIKEEVKSKILHIFDDAIKEETEEDLTTIVSKMFK